MFALLAQMHKLQKLDSNGEPALDSYLEMPGNTSDGDVWNPPEDETCCGIAYNTTPA